MKITSSDGVTLNVSIDEVRKTWPSLGDLADTIDSVGGDAEGVTLDASADVLRLSLELQEIFSTLEHQLLEDIERASDAYKLAVFHRVRTQGRLLIERMDAAPLNQMVELFKLGHTMDSLVLQALFANYMVRLAIRSRTEPPVEVYGPIVKAHTGHELMEEQLAKEVERVRESLAASTAPV